MNLYLDDDSVKAHLVALLRRSGHVNAGYGVRERRLSES